MKYDTARSYQAVYVIFKKDGKVAFVLRTNTDWMNDHYGLPAGKVEKGETYTQAAIREAKEEVGITLTPDQVKPVLTWQRHHDDTDWADVIFEATNWNGELYNAEPEVHGEVAWFSLDALPENVIPELRKMFTAFSEGVHLLETGWKESE